MGNLINTSYLKSQAIDRYLLTNSGVIVKIVELSGYSTSKDQTFQAAGEDATIRCVSWINFF